MASRQQDSSATEQAGEQQVNITNAPITEDERQVTNEREAALRRPFPWLAMAGALALTVLAVVAGVKNGAQYAIPFAIFAVLAFGFVAVHRFMGRAQTRRYDEGPAQEKAADDAEDPVPHFGFDEQSQLGQTAQLSDEEQAAHADMNKSTGQRSGS